MCRTSQRTDAQGGWQSHTHWRRVTGFGQVAEFAARLKKGTHVHITGYLRSREVEKPVNGKSKKNSATMQVLAWEVRAIRIAKLDRAVELNPSTDIPAGDPAF